MRRLSFVPIAALAALAMAAAPALAQVRTIDPDQAIDGDLAPSAQPTNSAPAPAPYAGQSAPAADQGVPVDSGDDAQAQQGTGYPVPSDTQQSYPAPGDNAQQAYPTAAPSTQYAPGAAAETQRNTVTQSADTYDRNDLMSAAEGVFGKGAEGLAGIIEKILKDQGQPNAYIAGREASGAFIVGLRYGSGMLYSKIEGQKPVYWTGPSVGFDVGGDANKVFVLVYNLYDTEELYKRFPAGEGHVYFVGGFSASYLRSGNTVLIPVRLGVGWRAGVNVGYMKFTHHEKWLPF
jgi:hypothetical protein